MKKHSEHLGSGSSTANRVPASLTDLEMTKLCAEAMGYEVVGFETKNGGIMVKEKTHHLIWNPLDDDEQAMALVKRFNLDVIHGLHYDAAVTVKHYKSGASGFGDKDLNRAIVECVAKMQKSTPAPSDESQEK